LVEELAELEVFAGGILFDEPAELEAFPDTEPVVGDVPPPDEQAATDNMPHVAAKSANVFMHMPRAVHGQTSEWA